MASFARVIAHSKRKGLSDEQPFMLGLQPYGLLRVTGRKPTTS
jgi:hypothetical protein